MSELKYSKKQIQPLIDKYAINPETNTTFARIIKMFDGKPNYQLWGVKIVFSKAATMDDLNTIKQWADNNPSLIKRLSKNGNIICYSSKEDINMLMVEMDGLCKIAFVKEIISRFNTDQRKILTENIKADKLDGNTCHTNKTFMSWFELFSKFNKLTANTKTKVIGRMSAVRNATEIKKFINDALVEKYAWNKEDLLSFAAINTPNCEVVYDKDNIVILQVHTYDESKTLCYSRTSWCITTSNDQWINYVTRDNNKQYFFFDFSKPEKDELAHVGFTVCGRTGIKYAHSTSDKDLLNGGRGIEYHGKRVNINKVLENNNIDLGIFMKINDSKFYKWDMNDLISLLERNTSDFVVVHNKDNRIIVNVLTNAGLKVLCGHTYIKVDSMPISGNTKCYLLFDFNLNNDNDKHIVAIYYKKDKYEIDTLDQVEDVFGTDIKENKYLVNLGITSDMYLNREDVNPSILLHKYIDERNEDGAISLIDKNKDVDINFVFNNRHPIFSAIEAKMNRLVGKIIANDKLNCDAEDEYGESLLQNLLFTYYLDSSVKLSEKEMNSVMEMINVIVDSGKFNLNYVDDNEDTLINIACMNKNMAWLVEKLSTMKDIDVNSVNDINMTALGTAIRFNNVDAIKHLGKRPDLVVSENDKKKAKEKGISLDKYIKPQPFNEVTEASVGTKVTAKAADADNYDKIFEKVFSTIKK